MIKAVESEVPQNIVNQENNDSGKDYTEPSQNFALDPDVKKAIELSNNLKPDFEKLKNDFDAFQKVYDSKNSKIIEKIYETRDHATANYISVLGIFASIVTFLLVEIQILQKTCSFYELLGLSLIIFSLLLSFNLFLFQIIKPHKNKIKLNFSLLKLLLHIINNRISVFLFCLSLSAFFLGILFANQSKGESCDFGVLDEKVEIKLNELNSKIKKIEAESFEQEKKIIKLETKVDLDIENNK